MEGATLDLGVVSGLGAEAFGEPGQRTFRLLIEGGEARISIWLEKEQIVALGGAIDELLRRVPEWRGREPSGELSPGFSGELDLRVGSLTLGYSEEFDGFLLEVSDFASPFGFTAIRGVSGRPGIERVSEQIDEIIAGSRPRCLLCGAPLTGGPHFCPPSNGHAHTANPE